MYQTRPANEYPNTAVVAPTSTGSLEEQFSYGLDHLRDGLGLAEITPTNGLRRKAQLVRLARLAFDIRPSAP
jgi:hypothetical protein